MNALDTPGIHPADTASMDDMSQLLATYAELADQANRQRFEDLLSSIARRITGDERLTQDVIESGGFVLDDVTVAIRFHDELQQIELFCDVGLPAPHAEPAAYRVALEHNLCRTYPGTTLGVHPQSGRLVATTGLHMALVTDEDHCVNAIQILADMAREVRAELRLQAG